VRAHLFNIIYFIGSYAQFPTDSSCVWYEILWAVQVISHYRIFVTIKYDQHSRTLINELTQGLKKHESMIHPRLYQSCLQFRPTRLKFRAYVQ
jgi:hypothetical protein